MNKYLFLCLIVLCACSFPIDLESKKFNTQLVAFAQMSKSGLELRLTRTIGLNEDIPLDASVIDATLHIYENEVFVGFFDIRNSGANLYSFQFIPDHSYRIEIRKDGYETLISESLVFRDFNSNWQVNIQDRSNLSEDEIGLFLTIQRERDDANIYSVDLEGIIENQIVYNSFKYDRSDSDFNSGCGVIQFRKYLFPNTCFQLENMFLPFTFNKRPAQLIGEDIPDGYVDKIQIKTGIVSDSFYKYLQNISSSERYFEDAFSEPLPEFTNFTGGFGVFYYIDEEVRILNLK